MDSSFIVLVGAMIGSVVVPIITAIQQERANRIAQTANQHYADQNRILLEQLKHDHGMEAVASALFPGGTSQAQPPPPVIFPKLRYWPMIVLALVAWSAAGVDIYVRHHSVTFRSDYVGKDPPKQVWRNEVVVLDGYRYVNCDFYNVTFEYDGTTPIQFDDNHVYGSILLKSANPAFTNWIIFLKAAGALAPRFRLFLSPNSKTDVPFEPTR